MQVSSVFIIGAGGTGSCLAEPLIRLLTNHPKSADCSIQIIDADILESKNLVRQMYPTEAVGVNKAQALVNKLQHINSNLQAVDDYVDEEMMFRLLWANKIGVSLIIGCVDNDPSRRAVLNAIASVSNRRDVIFMTPGNGLEKGQVYSHVVVGGNVVLRLPEERMVGKGDVPRKTGCFEQASSTPQLVSANNLSAAATLCNIQLLLDQGGLWGEIVFDVYRCKMDADSPVLIPGWNT